MHEQSRGLGFISAEAPAPLPLTAASSIAPPRPTCRKTREILRRHLGAAGRAFNFDTEGPRHRHDRDDHRSARRIRDVVHDADARGRPAEVGPSATRISAADGAAQSGSTRSGTRWTASSRRFRSEVDVACAPRRRRRACTPCRLAYSACVSGDGIDFIRIDKIVRSRSYVGMRLARRAAALEAQHQLTVERLAQLVDLDEPQVAVGCDLGRAAPLPSPARRGRGSAAAGRASVPCRRCRRAAPIRPAGTARDRARAPHRRIRRARPRRARIGAAQRRVEIVEELLQRPGVHPDQRPVQRTAGRRADTSASSSSSMRRSRWRVAVNDLCA